MTLAGIYTCGASGLLDAHVCLTVAYTFNTPNQCGTAKNSLKLKRSEGHVASAGEYNFVMLYMVSVHTKVALLMQHLLQQVLLLHLWTMHPSA